MKRKQTEKSGVQRSIASFFKPLRQKTDAEAAGSQRPVAAAAGEAGAPQLAKPSATAEAARPVAAAPRLPPPNLQQFALSRPAPSGPDTRSTSQPRTEDRGDSGAAPARSNHTGTAAAAGSQAEQLQLIPVAPQQAQEPGPGPEAALPPADLHLEKPAACSPARGDRDAGEPSQDGAAGVGTVAGAPAAAGGEPCERSTAGAVGADPMPPTGAPAVADEEMPDGSGAECGVEGRAGEGEDQESEGERCDAGETEYERARAERIRRNMEVMRGLGLGIPAVSPQRPQHKKPAARRKPPRPSATSAAESSLPLRRSSRRSGAGAVAEGSGSMAEGLEPPTRSEAWEEEPSLVFDDSSVLRYVCGVAVASSAEAGAADDGVAGSSCAGSGGARAAPEGACVTGFTQLPGTLLDPALARAYSVDWRPGLVVAGGKDGQVSIFGSWEVEGGCALPADGDVPPLLSARLHKGWIADVQLVRGAQQADSAEMGMAPADGLLERSMLLLTAGNDGMLCLWDVARSAAQGRGIQPQQLAKRSDLHSGGIFSMHELGGRVLTASKDGTLAVSALGAQGAGASGAGAIQLVRRYEEVHSSVVKCARWRDADCFASCGNDRSVCIVDTRQPGDAPALSLPEAHSTAINCLRWHPTSDHLLLSASHDPAILLHDLRRPAAPLFSFAGHSLQSRISAIYQPAFVWGGAGVATGGEKSGYLSLYCTATGSTLSRGMVGFAIGATFCGPGRQDPLICTATRAVHLLAPTWRLPA